MTPPSPLQAGVFGAALALLCLMWALALPFNLIKRTWLPIKIREPAFFLTCFISSSITAVAVISSKLTSNLPSCAPVSFFALSGFVVSCANYASWTHLLYRQFRLQVDAIKFIAQQRAQFNDDLVKQAIVLARLTERKKHFIYATVVSVIGVTAVSIYVGVHFSMMNPQCSSNHPFALAATAAVVNLIQGLCSLLAHLKLKDLDENFALASECFLDSIILGFSFVVAIVFCILAAAGSNSIDDTFPTLQLICGVICPILFAANRILGPFLALQMDRTSRQSFFISKPKVNSALLGMEVASMNESGTATNTSIMDHDFLSLLESKTGYLMFQEFLFKEFSVENLLFYSRTKNFEQKYALVKSMNSEDFEEMKLEAEEICSFFIDGNTPLHVNIRGENRKMIQDRIRRNSFSPTMFRDARTEIYDLMKYDSFPRFCAKHPQYGDVLINDKPSEQALRRSKQLVLGGL
jgi:hypothetical protein